jgi:hypothetical protein
VVSIEQQPNPLKKKEKKRTATDTRVPLKKTIQTCVPLKSLFPLHAIHLHSFTFHVIPSTFSSNCVK